MFAFGVLLARHPMLLARLHDPRWPALVLGLVAWLVLALYPGLLPGWPSVSEAWRTPMRLAFAGGWATWRLARHSGWPRAWLGLPPRRAARALQPSPAAIA